MAQRLTTTAYFGAALDLLAEQGSEAMTIAALSDRLGVTKGSFYHHFGGLPGFTEALLDYWSTEYGDQLLAAGKGAAAGERLELQLEAATALPHAAEAAIRAWGRSRPEVAEAVAAVDKRREKHLADAIVAAGTDRADARVLARLGLTVLIGAQLRETPVDVRKLRQSLQEFSRLVGA